MRGGTTTVMKIILSKIDRFPRFPRIQWNASAVGDRAGDRFSERIPELPGRRLVRRPGAQSLNVRREANAAAVDPETACATSVKLLTQGGEGTCRIPANTALPTNVHPWTVGAGRGRPRIFRSPLVAIASQPKQAAAFCCTLDIDRPGCPSAFAMLRPRSRTAPFRRHRNCARSWLSNRSRSCGAIGTVKPPFSARPIS